MIESWPFFVLSSTARRLFVPHGHRALNQSDLLSTLPCTTAKAWLSPNLKVKHPFHRAFYIWSVLCWPLAQVVEYPSYVLTLSLTYSLKLKSTLVTRIKTKTAARSVACCMYYRYVEGDTQNVPNKCAGRQHFCCSKRDHWEPILACKDPPRAIIGVGVNKKTKMF